MYWYVSWHIEVYHHTDLLYTYTYCKYFSDIIELGILSLVQSCYPPSSNNSLIIFHLQNYVCRLSVVPLVPSDWFNNQSLAREYRYRHALLYGSTCWLVVTIKFNQPTFRMKTLSSVHGICWRFLSNVLVAMGVSSGLCLKEMMHTVKLRFWLAALPCPSYLGDPTRWRYCYASTNFVLGSALDLPHLH